MVNITYVSGNESLFDRIQPLWDKLNCHLHTVSPYFKEYFQTLTFQERKKAILQRAWGGGIHVDLAYDDMALVGYCVSSFDKVLTGEIDSIFVEAKYRRQGIGTALMRKALSWLNSSGAKKNIISVTVGNEQTYGFYEKFDFHPRRTMLEQKKQ